MNDVEDVVKNCESSQRNSLVSPVFNPAQALIITGIFDRFGIDLVFGLPETAEGYVGIMVVTEYLTKYPFARPIKSKTALEIARILWEYISLFGPPKSILSDQGTEFYNSVVDTLLKLTGIEHKVTSAYNPRTNGSTERFNQALISSLRKHAENNHLHWHLWLRKTRRIGRD